MKWKIGNMQGLVKEGLNNEGKYTYFPLYSLKTVSWGRVGAVTRSSEPENGASVCVMFFLHKHL